MTPQKQDKPPSSPGIQKCPITTWGPLTAAEPNVLVQLFTFCVEIHLSGSCSLTAEPNLSLTVGPFPCWLANNVSQQPPSKIFTGFMQETNEPVRFHTLCFLLFSGRFDSRNELKVIFQIAFFNSWPLKWTENHSADRRSRRTYVTTVCSPSRLHVIIPIIPIIK